MLLYQLVILAILIHLLKLRNYQYGNWENWVPFSKRNEEWLQEFTSKYGKQALFVSYDVYDELNNQDLVNISGLRKTFGEVIINNVVRNGQNLGINWEIISELEKVEKITIIYSGGTAKRHWKNQTEKQKFQSWLQDYSQWEVIILILC